MKRFTILMIFLVAGCATSLSDDIKSVKDNYATIVFYGGVVLEEAKIIAQNQLVKRNIADIYALTKPLVKRDVSELPNYEDYWFIFFEEKKPAGIPFIFVVLIDKKNGKVKFSDDYNEDNQWILETALQRLEHDRY